MITNIHHIAILTSNIEEAIKFYMDFLNCDKPKVITVEKKDMKFKSAMLPIGKNGKTYLQILEPAKGQGVEELYKNGEGTIFEVGYELKEIEKLSDKLLKEGTKPVNFNGKRIEGKYIVSSFGNRYFFIPKNKMRGTRTEIVQIVKK